ncbi:MULTISPECIES: MarR family winged helix-turn-helix transcriptional regulator [Streptomyces]|uniref:Putative MarR-family transcriptional regulator n=1 Tax=Streptomyces albus (strain ATCC 21838 / DSM 41398 / FERM P-419 / JCM 4703 / NBRC 107858) TaxID=1081613 RepID=A0A0B5EWT2_STRA4|nr:MarR family transcriptional regulator [Streptomyces sp. SCSIO ZS0520]AJE86259.1 putative MarR-family transcriptional regulator [Streptomyces albus]AOU80561.1 putative MarR-family transcriptional regulator [Streptomyces albus]AYN36271.1 MarR family transcriptional regulator [Streptomyces albus]
MTEQSSLTGPPPGGGEQIGRQVDEAEEVALAVTAVSRLFVEISARSLASVDGTLTLPQLRALVVLERCGPVKLAALASVLGVNPSTALRMVERLEAQDLAHRAPNPGNRREVVLRMSAKGQSLVDRVLRHRQREIRALVDRLPAGDRPQLLASLHVLARAAGGQVDEDPLDEVRRVAGLVDDPLNPSPRAGGRLRPAES